MTEREPEPDIADDDVDEPADEVDEPADEVVDHRHRLDRDAPVDLDLPKLYERLERSLLGGPREFTRQEVAQAAGLHPDESARLWRALGFATVGDDERVFTRSDIEALHQARYLADNAIVDDDLRLSMTRMLGQSFSRLAAWQAQLAIEVVERNPELTRSDDGVAEFLEELLPVMERIQTFVWRRQLLAYFSRVVSHASAEVTAPGLAPTVVGFADMSGFTTLTRRSSESELRELLEAFESLATEVVGAHGGRIVKTIGDEVLFVADSPVDGAGIALDLIDATGADDRLLPLRIGLAAGPVVSRLGDVYGSTVNIASRLTSLCRPGWVLVDRIMAEALADDPAYSLRPRRPESVRGYHHLRQWRLRRADDTRRGRGRTRGREIVESADLGHLGIAVFGGIAPGAAGQARGGADEADRADRGRGDADRAQRADGGRAGRGDGGRAGRGDGGHGDGRTGHRSD